MAPFGKEKILQKRKKCRKNGGNVWKTGKNRKFAASVAEVCVKHPRSRIPTNLWRGTCMLAVEFNV